MAPSRVRGGSEQIFAAIVASQRRSMLSLCACQANAGHY